MSESRGQSAVNCSWKAPPVSKRFSGWLASKLTSSLRQGSWGGSVCRARRSSEKEVIVWAWVQQYSPVEAGEPEGEAKAGLWWPGLTEQNSKVSLSVIHEGTSTLYKWGWGGWALWQVKPAELVSWRTASPVWGSQHPADPWLQGLVPQQQGPHANKERLNVFGASTAARLAHN